jgi:hypothetical protein
MLEGDLQAIGVDQRRFILPRYTQPSSDTKLLVEKLRLELPSQPPTDGRRPFCGGDLFNYLD